MRCSISPTGTSSATAPAAVVLGSREDGKVHLVCNFDDARGRACLDASDVVKAARPHIGGGGGGRPTMARAGGTEPEKLGDALAAAERLIIAALCMKVLALDYGSARTGVAVSDPTGTVARPLCTVERAATTPGSPACATRRARRRPNGSSSGCR